MDYETFLESRINRRASRFEKMMDGLERRMDEAEKQIGQICRNGETIYYVYPPGGKYREGTRADLVDFLIRNRYA